MHTHSICGPQRKKYCLRNKEEYRYPLKELKKNVKLNIPLNPILRVSCVITAAMILPKKKESIYY